ncbi:MAG: DUF4347 domain-containing protein [Burkholderiaceae bacterium]
MGSKRHLPDKPARHRGRREHRRLSVEALEPRILFSAEWAALGVDELNGSPLEVRVIDVAPANLPTRDTARASDRELVIVDERVPAAESLIEELRATREHRHFDILFLSADDDGLARIAEFAQGQEAWRAIHVFSHASPGRLQLGADILSSETLDRNAGAFAQWADWLTDDADILLYGCDLAANADGRAFIAALAAHTGADVAASDDPTGTPTLGGDFELETHHGHIETEVALSAAAQANFSGALAIYTVTNTGDSGAGSLRQAILDANANIGADQITFDLGQGDAGYVDPDASPGNGDEYWSIAPLSALPDISDTVVLDAATQPGFSGRPVIELDGTGAGAAVDGLRLVAGSDGSTIRGFAIGRFAGDGIETVASAGSVITGNHVGTDVSGTIERGNSLKGIRVTGSSTGVRIGGTGAGAGNLVTGNRDDGIYVIDSGAVVVQGNRVGVDASGLSLLTHASLVAGSDGIAIVNSNDFTVGGTVGTSPGGAASGAANVVAGFKQTMMFIYGSDGGTIQGNYLGTNAAGTAGLDLGTRALGIVANAGTGTLTIGGASAGARNIIAGLSSAGILLGNATGGVIGATVQGNYLGLDTTGSQPLGLGYAGIVVQNNSADVVIGGSAPGEGNVIAAISFNGVFSGYPDGLQAGIAVNGTTASPIATVIRGNWIGTDAQGDAGAAFGTGRAGVLVSGSPIGTAIGGVGIGDGNLITGANVGVEVSSRIQGGSEFTPVATSVLGNRIYDNASLAVDLTRDLVDDPPILATSDIGVTANDVGDIDTGPNEFLNFPDLTTARLVGASTLVSGSYDGLPSKTIRIEFFAAASADPSGHGQSERYLGAAEVMTDGAGHATFEDVVVDTSVAGEAVSAIATVNLGGGDFGPSSELSAAIDVFDQPEAPVLSAASVSVAENTATGTPIVMLTATDPDLGGTLSYAILAASQPGALALDPVTGVVSVADMAMLDFEAHPSLTLQIRVTDDTGLSDESTLTVNVQDLNEPPTALRIDNALAPLLAGQSVGRVLASDPDADEQLTFSLLGTAAQVFKLGPTDGTLQIGSPAPVFSASGYPVTIAVDDSAGNRFIQTITLRLFEIDVGAPATAPLEPLAPPDRAPTPAPAATPAPKPAATPSVSSMPPQSPASANDPSAQGGISGAASTATPTAVATPSASAPEPPAAPVPPLLDASPAARPRTGPLEGVGDTKMAVRTDDTAGLSPVAPAEQTRQDPSAASDAGIELTALTVNEWNDDFTGRMLTRPTSARGSGAVDATDANTDSSTADAIDTINQIPFDLQTLAGSVVGTATVWWIARAGGVLTSLLIGAPVWRSIDPLPIALSANPVTEESECVDSGTISADTEAHLPI